MYRRFPYDLRIKTRGDLSAHQQIAEFTDRWLVYIRRTHSSIVHQYMDFRLRNGYPEIGFAESVLELTALSVYLKEHLQEVGHFSQIGAGLLSILVELQDRLPWFERPIKLARGLVSGLSSRKASSILPDQQPDQNSIPQLNRWLRAQGQGILAEHFQVWNAYFLQLESPMRLEAITNFILLANHFSAFSEEVLGRYTLGANAFQQEARKDSRFRYDLTLRCRSRVEYHLGLMGTEILNREFRLGFLETEEKLVIVPRCLRARPAGECKAVPARLGTRCTGCTPNCQVNQINQICQPHNIHVADIPDDQLKFLCRASGQAGSGLGVLGLSCAPTNWIAGWEAQKLGLNAQGLLLDYSACREHWHDQGIPTSTNLNRLTEMLGLVAIDPSLDPIISISLEETPPLQIA